MPRPAAPYIERDYYISRAGGDYVRLCHKREGIVRARTLLHEHLTRPKLEKGLTVSALFQLFLRAVEVEKSPHTLVDYKRWCDEFGKKHGEKSLTELSRRDAQQFMQDLRTSTWVRNKQKPQPYKPKTINHAIISLKRAFNWAIEGEYLDEGKNPFARMKRLPSQGRQRIATQDEFERLLAHCTDDHFRHVLIAMRYTPARPGDIRTMRWSMVLWERRMWVIREHKTSKTAREPKPLVIGMNEVVERMLRERQLRYGGEGHVFTNRKGEAWKRQALVLRMRRLRKRAGVGADDRGEEFVLYTQRHTFISTAGLDPSIPEAVRTDVAGHTDGRTTRLYTHIRDEVIAEAGRKVADGMG